MKVFFQSPIVIQKPIYSTVYDAIDDGESSKVTATKVLVSGWKIKLRLPFKVPMRETVFRSKPTAADIRKLMRFQRLMSRQGIQLKCVCGLPWYPGSKEYVTQGQCPANTHKNQPCVECMSVYGGDVCGSHLCSFHQQDFYNCIYRL